MKKLMMVAMLAGSFAGGAATFEEQYALSRIPNSKVTAANAQAVIDASIATTNYDKIAYCRSQGFISFEKVNELLAGKWEFRKALFNNAMVSSNKTLQAAVIADLLAMDKNEEKTDDVLYNAVLYFDHTAERKISVAKELMKVGKQFKAIRPLYAHYNNRVFVNNPEYVQFCKGVSDELLTAWLAVEPKKLSNGRLNNAVSDGLDIIRYFFTIRDDRAQSPAVIEKATKYAKDGQKSVLVKRLNTPFFIACANAFLESGDFGSEDYKIIVAQDLDKVNKNKNTSKKILYPQLKNNVNKIKVALYLNDTDKLIDILKVVDDNLDAKMVESVIAPLNDVNAGYRTDDLRLALMNINKKYTLKLYDDRDTWEPILSKIRAMIDAR
jgi:hypothetical protein